MNRAASRTYEVVSTRPRASAVVAEESLRPDMLSPVKEKSRRNVPSAWASNVNLSRLFLSFYAKLRVSGYTFEIVR